MTDARALHCPNCGGPAEPGQSTCRYCRAALATVSCAKCFAMIFDTAVYCPSCGARRTRKVGTAVAIPCPSCRGQMRDLELGETAMLECERCRGNWVDAATFEHICADHAAQAAVIHQISPPPPAGPSAEIVRYRKCVACGKMMNRLNFGRLSGTVVDGCKGHGTFLDAGELHAIVRFIQGGGLDRARQRQIEELKEHEQRLRAAEQTPHLPAPGRMNIAAHEGFDWMSAAVDLLSLLDHLRR